MPPPRYVIPAERLTAETEWSVVLNEGSDGAVELVARRQLSCGGWVTLTLSGLRRGPADGTIHLRARDLELNLASHRVRDRGEAGEAFRQFAAWLLSSEPRIVELEPSGRQRRAHRRGEARFDRGRRPI
jgi:hypothetical protein